MPTIDEALYLYQEPTLQQAILQLVARAVKDEYITGDGNRVMLSIDLLTQLGCVPEGTEEAIAAILSRFPSYTIEVVDADGNVKVDADIDLYLERLRSCGPA